MTLHVCRRTLCRIFNGSALDLHYSGAKLQSAWRLSSAWVTWSWTPWQQASQPHRCVYIPMMASVSLVWQTSMLLRMLHKHPSAHTYPHPHSATQNIQLQNTSCEGNSDATAIDAEWGRRQRRAWDSLVDDVAITFKCRGMLQSVSRGLWYHTSSNLSSPFGSQCSTFINGFVTFFSLIECS